MEGASDFLGSHSTDQTLVWSWAPGGHPRITLVALAGNLGVSRITSHISIMGNTFWTANQCLFSWQLQLWVDFAPNIPIIDIRSYFRFFLVCVCWKRQISGSYRSTYFAIISFWSVPQEKIQFTYIYIYIYNLHIIDQKFHIVLLSVIACNRS